MNPSTLGWLIPIVTVAPMQTLSTFQDLRSNKRQRTFITQRFLKLDLDNELEIGSFCTLKMSRTSIS